MIWQLHESSIPYPDKPEIPNRKYQTNHNDRNSKSQTCSGYRKPHISLFWSLDIGICNLFVICLPAVFLAGCLLFEILTGVYVFIFALNTKK